MVLARLNQRTKSRMGALRRRTAVGALGIPGVTVPEPNRTQHAREEAATPRLDVEEFVREEQDEAFRRADVAGDRTASWRDMEKLRAPHREKVRGTDEKK